MAGLNLEAKAKARARENGPGSPREDVGEIDSRMPFRSVKAAVTLFGEVVSPKATSPVIKKLKAEERVLEKETQHHMMLRERGYYTNQLRSAEAAKAQALRDLRRANTTLKQLTNKLDSISESKQASIKATEDAKIRAKELEELRDRRAQLGDDAWKVDVSNERERYKAASVELVGCKQELSNLRQDFNAALATKMAVFQKAGEEEQKAQINQERQRQLSKEVDELCKALEQVKLISLQAQEELSKRMEEKENSLMSYKLAKEEAEKEIKSLKDEYVPAETLQENLEETKEVIKVLHKKLNEIQSSDLYIIRKMDSELDSAKEALEVAVAEENSLRIAIDSIQQELKEVKKKLPESEKKALKAESAVEKMQGELEKEVELERAMSGSAFVMSSSINKHLVKAEKAKHEAEDIKANAELLKQEAEAARTATKEAEEKLKIALQEAEAAKAAEKLTEERIYNLSRSEAAELPGLGSSRKIRLTVEEFELANKKIEDFRNQADLKVASATAQVEAINAREKGISQQLEERLKEKEALQSDTENALKRAKNAKAAKTMVENELQKWRQKELHQVAKSSLKKFHINC